MELLVDRVEDDGRHRVVAHERGQLEDSALPEEVDARANVAELSFRLRNSSRPNAMMTASSLPSRFPQPAEGPAALHDFDDLRVEAFGEAAGSCAVHSNWLSSSRATTRIAKLGQASIQRGLEAQVLIRRSQQPGELRRMEPDAARPRRPTSVRLRGLTTAS